MKNPKHQRRLWSGVALSLLCLQAPISAISEVAEQEPMVVTANRWPERHATAMPSMTVITRADIERLLAVDVMDLLSLVPGIDVVRTGPTGAATSIFVRGSNSNHVLVLVDGVRVASANTGAFAWEHLPAAQIERIEILRGPRASLYGSDAIGGVIHIFTREHQGTLASLAGGRYDTVETTLGYGVDFAQTRGHVSVQLGGRGSRGFSATNAANWFYDPDNDGYANLNASLKARWQPDWGLMRLSYLETRGDTDFDQGNSDSEHRTLGGAIQIDGDQWRHEFLFGANQQNLYTAAFSSRFKSERLSTDWLARRTLEEAQSVSFGVSWYQNISQIGIDSPYQTKEYNLAGFVNWQGLIGDQQLEASIRHDYFSRYAGQTTGNLGWRTTLAPGWHVGTSLGNAFRAPSVNEFFYAQVAVDDSARYSLLPEKSLSGELYVHRRSSKQGSWRATFFKQRIEDLIQFVPAQPDEAFSPYVPRNVAQAEILGLELDGRWHLNDWILRANATIQDTLDRRADVSLLRRPDRKASIQLDRRWHALSAGVTLLAASQRTDFNGSLPGFATLDMRLHYRINPNWQASVKIHNLANRNYQLAAGYNTPGRAIWLQLQWQQHN